jgi:hypothetical protein
MRLGVRGSHCAVLIGDLLVLHGLLLVLLGKRFVLGDRRRHLGLFNECVLGWIRRQTLANIKQNLIFAFVYNAAGVPIAAGALYPWLGVLMNR